MVSRVSWVLLGGTVFAVSFYFRFIAEPEVTNDFFMHVVVGRQMVLGDWLVRDIVDPGLPLMHAMSALAERLGGYSLLSEVTVSLIFISLGAVLVFVLSAEASRSRVIGLLVTIPVVLVAPRLYAYPKLFCYPLAVWAMWRYLERPNLTRTLWLGVVTAVAFLFRHDHGVFIGMAIAAMLVVRHWSRGVVVSARAVAAYLLVVAVFLFPYLAYVQVHGGLVSYVQAGVDFSRTGARQGGHVWPTWVLPPEATPPQIHVRWSPDFAADDAARGDAEQSLDLWKPEPLAGETWRYTLGDRTPENVRALLGHPAAVDTEGIDRATGEVRGVNEVSGDYLLRRLRRQAPLADGAVALTAANAIPILFYLVYALPLAAIGIVIYRGARGGDADERARIGGLACLALLANVGMLRHPLSVRVADVMALPAITGAWLSALAFGAFGLTWARFRERMTGAGGVSARSVARAVAGGFPGLGAVLVLGVACMAAAEGGGIANWFKRTGFDDGMSAARVVSASAEAYRQLSISPPVDWWAPPGSRGHKALARYLHECTRVTDRVFVTGFLPEISFFSGRGFAGGHAIFMEGQHGSPSAQRLTLDRLRRQSVPIAMLEGGAGNHPRFVAAYFRRWYRPVTSIDPDTVGDLTVMVDRRRVPSGHYAPLDAPCYS